MRQFLHPACDKVCRGVEYHVDMHGYVNDVEQRALDAECDIAGGVIHCDGPVLQMHDQGINDSCRATCAEPYIYSEKYPKLAKEFQKQVRTAIDELFDMSEPA